MTLIEIRNEILGHFLDNDTFIIPLDCSKIKLSKKQEPFKTEILESALDDMVEDGMCNKAESQISGEIAYVLSVPLAAQSQKVEISQDTAEAIHNILKQYTEANGVDYICNKLDINENDVRNVIMILSQLLESQDKED